MKRALSREFLSQPASRLGRSPRKADEFRARLASILRSDGRWRDGTVARAFGWAVQREDDGRRRSRTLEKWSRIGRDFAEGPVAEQMLGRYQAHRAGMNFVLRVGISLWGYVTREDLEMALERVEEKSEDCRKHRDSAVLILGGRTYRAAGVPAALAFMVHTQGRMPTWAFVAAALGVPEERLLADLKTTGGGMQALRLAADLILAQGFCPTPRSGSRRWMPSP